MSFLPFWTAFPKNIVSLITSGPIATSGWSYRMITLSNDKYMYVFYDRFRNRFLYVYGWCRFLMIVYFIVFIVGSNLSFKLSLIYYLCPVFLTSKSNKNKLTHTHMHMMVFIIYGHISWDNFLLVHYWNTLFHVDLDTSI